jgi:hypothetical protein
MTGEIPLDLRSLANVESPEVVQSALRRFRRRVLSTGALVLLAAVGLVGGILWTAVFHQTLEERISEAPGAWVGAVYEGRDTTTVLKRVARLEDGVGLNLLLAAPEAQPRDEHFYRIAGTREFDEAGSTRAHDFYLVVPPPEDGRINVSLVRQRGCRPDAEGFCRAKPVRVERFVIDLVTQGVPEDVWAQEG